jgi:hypothetical protein
MKALLPGLALFFGLLASPAAAQVAGSWAVNGSVSGHEFVLDCTFAPASTTLGGVCVETKTGKTHPITKGSVNGNQLAWSYKASYMMFNFDVDFAGVMTGGKMAGTVTASGRNGSFTAARQ